ncbi:MFS general substrate transporter [Imleria badia]|nr:MFS general substrate transporter [Imleria badia]
MKNLATPFRTSTILPVTQSSENDAQVVHKNSVPSKKRANFLLIFTFMCICLSLSALELSSISPALPTIANDFHASKYTWVGSAYALSSTAFLPMSGGLAQAFGRRPAILVTIAIFALGTGICGGANSMNMLIAGRAIQGFGGGAVQSLTGIILADLVTLRERGLYVGLYAFAWCTATSIGPFVGGSLAALGLWRWLFYLNLLLLLVSWVSFIFLLDLPIPTGSYRDKFMRMDWVGNFLVISSTVAYAIGLTWGGITAPWVSTSVLVPLVLGLVGLGVFIAYEATLATHPLVPFSLMTNMTSISGYIQTICSYVVTSAVVYYFPIYFMACKGTSSMVSGIYSLGFASLAPAAIITGFSVKATGRYRPQTWIGWTFIIIALGLMSELLVRDSPGKSIGFLVLLGCGAGMLAGTALYPIQAPLPVALNAHALAFMWFLRSFASLVGITIGSTVLQHELAKRLPASFIQSVPQGTAIIYALIPQLSVLSQRTRSEVEVASADSLAVLWRVLAVVSGAGLMASFFMRGLPLHNRLDPDWTLKNEKVPTNVSVGVREEEVLDISTAAAGVRSRFWLPSFEFRSADDLNAAMMLELATSRARARGERVPDADVQTIAAGAKSRPWLPSFQVRADELNATAMLLELATSGFC